MRKIFKNQLWWMKLGLTITITILIVLIPVTLGWKVDLSYISGEAWMSFLGALVGAIITIAGSVYVIEFQRRRGDRLRRSFFDAALAEVMTVLDTLQANTPAEVERQTGRTIVAQAGKVEAGLVWLDKIMEWQPPDTLALLRAYDEVRQISDQSRQSLLTNCQDAAVQPQDTMPGVIGASHPIRQRLRTAIQLLA